MKANYITYLAAIGSVVGAIIILSFCEKSPTNHEIAYEEEILFVSGRLRPEVPYAIRPDGTGLRKIIEGGYLYGDAAFSPSKRYIAVVGFNQIYIPPVILILDHDGNLIRQLTNNGLGPVWSPDEDKILFVRLPYFATVISNVFIINADGTGERQLTDSDWELLSPLDWSSDGDIVLGHEIIFYEDSTTGRRGSNRGEIALFTPEWDLLRYLTDNDVGEPSARFSPSADSVVFVSGVYCKRDVYVMDLQSGDTTNVTNVPGEYHSVEWSPRGGEIAFTEVVFDANGHEVGSDIRILNLETDILRSLTNTALDSVYNRVVDWR